MKTTKVIESQGKVRVTARLLPGQWRRVQQIAKVEGLTVEAMLGELVEYGIEEWERDQEILEREAMGIDH